MGHNMDRGNVGRQNKPKLSIQEKKQKKLLKKLAKQQAAAALMTPPTHS